MAGLGGAPMKLSDIRTRILESLNDSASSPVFWSTTEMDDVIQEAQEVLAEELALIKRWALVPLREGATYYYTPPIATDIMAPYRLTLTHLDRRLEVVTMGQLDERHEGWSTITGDPWHWFPVSWDLFGIFPHPTTAGGVMRLDYIAWPTEPQHDSESLEMPDPEQDAMVLYGVYDGLLKQWDIQRALQIFALFLQRIPKGQGRANVELQASNVVRSFYRESSKTGVSI